MPIDRRKKVTEPAPINRKTERENNRPAASYPLRTPPRLEDQEEEKNDHAFRSMEQQSMDQVTPYSNYEGGWELDLRQVFNLEGKDPRDLVSEDQAGPKDVPAKTVSRGRGQ